jgi:hypothetical protein
VCVNPTQVCVNPTQVYVLTLPTCVLTLPRCILTLPRCVLTPPTCVLTPTQVSEKLSTAVWKRLVGVLPLYAVALLASCAVRVATQSALPPLWILILQFFLAQVGGG